MKKLNLPIHPIKLKKEGDLVFVFDPIRKKWLQNAPEEWVRQHFLNFMVHDLGYPLSLIETEKAMKVNGQLRRSDILANSTSGDPLVLVECKAPNIKITQSVFDQIARYNLTLSVPILIVSNGLEHYCCMMDYENQSYAFLKDIPSFNEAKEYS